MSQSDRAWLYAIICWCVLFGLFIVFQVTGQTTLAVFFFWFAFSFSILRAYRAWQQSRERP